MSNQFQRGRERNDRKKQGGGVSVTTMEGQRLRQLCQGDRDGVTERKKGLIQCESEQKV